MPCQEVAKMTDQQVVKVIVLFNTHFLNQINFVGLFNSSIFLGARLGEFI